jgi:hypothetical protein
MGPSVASTRPDAPDQAMLEEASARLSQRLGFLVGTSWKVLDRFDRPRSTVFKLQNVSPEHEVQIFYKAYVISESHSIPRSARIQRHREAFAVETQLGNTLRLALARESIRFDEPLALDPQKLVAVRTAVPGRQLGKALTFAVPGRQRLGRQVYRQVGQALRIIEQVGSIRATPDSFDIGREALRNVDSSAPYLSPSQRTRIEGLLALYSEAIDSNEALAWTHGDISPTNILQNREGIGIIDFTWSPKPRFSDVARLIARLEMESPRSRRWTASMCAEVMRGFGVDPAGPGAAWYFARLDTAIRAIRRKRPRVQRWGQEVLREFGAT